MDNMQSANTRRLVDGIGLEGLVEIEVYRAGQLVDVIREKNIILYQGNREIITSLSSFPLTSPRLIARMAVGDQGTIPSDSTVPKVPVKTMTALYHEIYRKTVDDKILTINPGTTFVISATLTGNNALVTTSSTTGIAPGMSVTGANVPLGTIVQAVNSLTQFLMSNQAISPVGTQPQPLSISGAANECKFVATFNAVDVPLTSYSNPSQPRINEVGMVILDPTYGLPGIRLPVSAPNPPPSDEVLASIRTFKSVPFEIANDVSITIRYTIFLA